MSSIETLAYFLEEGVLRGILPQWPARMNLVLCMDEAGKCALVVYHENEASKVLGKVANVLEKPLGSFSVSPKVAGCPTRKVRFSEEQQLLALVAEADQLCETASDYAINYNFAREEGLDPETLTGTQSATAYRLDASMRRDTAKEASKPRGASPAVAKVAPKPTPKAPALSAGYAKISEDDRRECHFLDGVLSVSGPHVRLTINPGAFSSSHATIQLNDIAFRDDFARFALTRAALGGTWRPGVPVRLEVATSLFPDALVERFRQASRAATVTITQGGIFVAPGDVVDDITPVDAPAPKPGKVARRRFRTPARLMFVGLAVLGLISGTVLSALQGA